MFAYERSDSPLLIRLQFTIGHLDSAKFFVFEVNPARPNGFGEDGPYVCVPRALVIGVSDGVVGSSNMLVGGQCVTSEIRVVRGESDDEPHEEDRDAANDGYGYIAR